MEIFVALRDSEQPLSYVVGAFSSEPLAQAACQEDETARGWDRDAITLVWKNAEAQAPDGGQYVVILVNLDARN